MEEDFETTILNYYSDFGGFPYYLNYCWLALKLGNPEQGLKARSGAIESTVGADFEDDQDVPNDFVKELNGMCIILARRFKERLNTPDQNKDCFSYSYIQVLTEILPIPSDTLKPLCKEAMKHLKAYIDFRIQNQKGDIMDYEKPFINYCIQYSQSIQKEHFYIDFQTVSINNQYYIDKYMEGAGEGEGEEQEGVEEELGQGEAPKHMEGVEDQMERSNIQQAFDEFLMTTKQKFSELIPKAINNTKFDCLRIDDIKNFMKKRYRQFLPSEAVFYYNILWEALAYYKDFNPSQELEGITKKEILGITDDLFLQKETILETFDRIRPYYNITVSN